MPNVALRVPHCAGCDQTGAGALFCHQCGQVKALAEFYPDRKGGPGCYHSGCRPCRKAAAAAYSRATYVPTRKKVP